MSRLVIATDSRLLETLAQPPHHLGCITLEKPFDLDQFLSAIGLADRPHGFDWLIESPAWLSS
jgi:hypothetical protein